MKPIITTITTREVDELCLAYEAKKIIAERAQADAADAKAALIDEIARFGYVPANAEKSMRLDGILKVATSTTGSTVEVKSEAVTRFELALSAAKKARIFKSLFTRQVKYALVKDAAATLQQALVKSPAPMRAKLTSLLAACFDVNSKTPSLAVEDVATLKAREEKAAKKAGKQ